MLNLIQDFEDLIQNLICWIETAMVDILNASVSAVAAMVAYVLTLLPAMPSLPSVPSVVSQGVGYGDYFFPFSYLLTLMGIVATLWIAWLVIAIPLRWGKAAPGND